MDQRTTLFQLKKLVEAFVRARDWEQFHSPKNLSIALAVEAAELMDLFKWHTEAESVQIMRKPATKMAASDEIADIIIYSLAFANRNGIDLALSIRRKLFKNRTKYPVRKFKGRF